MAADTQQKRISAHVVADSISLAGARITTVEVTFPRIILAELNTHRAFSRNSASSRARSVQKTIAEVEADPYVPSTWPSERRGMAGGASVDTLDQLEAVDSWTRAAKHATEHARDLVDCGVHKSIVNRLLEPFMWHTTVITATDWSNFFEQRLALLDDGVPAADPPMFELAQRINDALAHSTPEIVNMGEWHLPYVTQADAVMGNTATPAYEQLRYVSAARCAGVSYLTQNAEGRSVENDLALYHRLRNANPPHWSPLEHVATPLHRANEDAYNLRGWASLRWFETV